MAAKRFVVFVLCLCCASPALADKLFIDGFDPPVIAPLFPHVAGTFQLPPGPTTNQLAWILSELQIGQTTTAAEAQAHFDPAFNYQSIADFMNALRTQFPAARVTDVVAVTALEVVVVIDGTDGTGPEGFVVLQAHYSGSKLVTYFSVSNYYGSVEYVADQALTLTQAADKFTTLSTDPALLIARIRPGMQCEVVLGRNETQARATASMFKLWVLGGVARAIVYGTISTDSTLVTLVTSELAPGALTNSEPIGTVFPLQDVMTLMMGISDNTATDLLHQLVGRDWIDQTIDVFENAHPDLLKPILGISEQFHLFFSFDLTTAQSYVNGDQAFKQQFVHDQIEPLGSMVGDAYTYSNVSLFTDGSWRASPMDVCKAYAHLLRLPQGSDAITAVNLALGAQVAQPEVRGKWDRVWYKGGSLVAANNDYHVLTHSWLLQNADQDPWVVIAMSNSDGGGIDLYNVQSVTARILELVDQLPP